MYGGRPWKSNAAFKIRYSWWKKSYTTWDVQNPLNNGISTISTGAGFFFHQQFYREMLSCLFKKTCSVCLIVNGCPPRLEKMDGTTPRYWFIHTVPKKELSQAVHGCAMYLFWLQWCIYNMCMYSIDTIGIHNSTCIFICNMWKLLHILQTWINHSAVNVHGKDLNLVEAHELTLKKPRSCRTGLTGWLSLSHESRICNSKGN